MSGDSLTRMPRGFDADHRLSDDLRRKDFIAVAPLTREQVVSPDLLDGVLQTAEAGRPLLQVICDALGVAR